MGTKMKYSFKNTENYETLYLKQRFKDGIQGEKYKEEEYNNFSAGCKASRKWSPRNMFCGADTTNMGSRRCIAWSQAHIEVGYLTSIIYYMVLIYMKKEQGKEIFLIIV